MEPDEVGPDKKKRGFFNPAMGGPASAFLPIVKFLKDGFVEDVKQKGRVAADIVNKVQGGHTDYATGGDYASQALGGAVSLATGGAGAYAIRPIRRAILRSPVGKPVRKLLYEKALEHGGNPAIDHVAMAKFLNLDEKSANSLAKKVHQKKVVSVYGKDYGFLDSSLKQFDQDLKNSGHYLTVPSDHIPLSIKNISQKVASKTHGEKDLEYLLPIPKDEIRRIAERTARESGHVDAFLRSNSYKGPRLSEDGIVKEVAKRAGFFKKAQIEEAVQKQSADIGRDVSNHMGLWPTETWLGGQRMSAHLDRRMGGVNVGGADGDVFGGKGMFYDIYDFGDDFRKNHGYDKGFFQTFKQRLDENRAVYGGPSEALKPYPFKKNLKSSALAGLKKEGTHILDDAGKPFVTVLPFNAGSSSVISRAKKHAGLAEDWTRGAAYEQYLSRLSTMK